MADIEGLDDLMKKLERLPSLVTAKRAIAKALRQGAEPIRARAEDLAPDDPATAGGLKERMMISVREQTATGAVALIGPSRKGFYGCVFGGKVYVSVAGGQKKISQIKIGDKVLTQTGEFREVLGTQKYPAADKPDLVTIVAKYRHGQSHTLTLTADHEVLVFREGRHAWIPAGELVLSDKVIKRTKKSWSEGTGIVTDKICERCNRPYQLRSGGSQGKRFCSGTCARAWTAERHIGMKRSADSKAKMSATAKRKLAERPELHPNRIMAKRGRATAIEKSIESWLSLRGLTFQRQYPIGRMFADFYLPATKTVIEADGAYWHRNQARDIERDKYMVTHAPGIKVVHLHFFDKRFSPTLELNPMPGVFYVPCNPGPKSFVEPSVFASTEIVSLKRWRYEQQPCTKPTYLYDLSVEGVHSFVASGLVISNSFQEFGTAHHAAQPFLRPAADEQHDKAVAIIGEVLAAEIEKALQ